MLSSCAGLYVGEDLPEVRDSELTYLDKTITIRFVGINLKSQSEKSYLVQSFPNKEYQDYINLHRPFKKIVFADFPYEYVSVSGDDSLVKLLQDTRPAFNSDYFVDIFVTTPYWPHGSGTGMYGLFINILTLGILPTWWVHNNHYQIKVYAQNKEFNSFELQESYHEFSSVLFNAVPGSDRKGRSFNLSSIDKNVLKAIMLELQKQIHMN